ncbi:3-phosphoshikimate 1-carboxyvinyltransferase [Achromatium sp. WMS2]|nr:3-phosphoshikimate 1-carboxyvinyltransferase [Achromatium sp. WMS2]
MTKNNNIMFSITPGSYLTGKVEVPGDKSISHRAIMLGAVATGTSYVTGFLEGEDCLSTLKAFVSMGVNITKLDNNRIKIDGVGLHGLKAPQAPLDLGNSGTSMRLLSGLLAAQPFASVLTGDQSLTHRPMRRVTIPLTEMGANITTSSQGYAPIHIEPTEHLTGIDYKLPVASAQIKSCLLLAGLYARGKTCISEPVPSRDHTERMLTSLGYALETTSLGVCIQSGSALKGSEIKVPGDISSAAFFLVGASIAPHSDLILANVGMNPTRNGVIKILQAMGANIEILDQRMYGGEPVVDIRVRSADLHGINISAELVPSSIDEFPAIFVAAACASGETRLSGAAELRVKESDRIQVMVDGLVKLGIEAIPQPDGIWIRGGKLGSATISSHGDHRIAMAFAMAGLRAAGTIVIDDCANVKTSFPNFVELAASAGLNITVL